MKLLSLTLMCAFICATTAAPAASDSVVPETGLLQVTVDATAADDAKNTVETMLAAGSDSSACGDLADSIIADVVSVVKQQEELLDALSDGSDCQSEGQDVVDAAQNHLTEAQQTKTSADTAAATAASAPVDLGSMSLSQLGNGQCVDLRNDPAFIAAKKMNDDAQAAATTAAAELTAAQNALSDAQEAQKEAIKACQCKAHETYESAYEKANTRSDEDLAAWKKGKHMKCVLAGTDPSSCSVGAPPAVTKRTLAEGVDQSACKPVLGCASGGYAIPGLSTNRWYSAPRVGMSCNELCQSCGKSFSASETAVAGTTACKFFHPDFKAGNNWVAISCGAIDHNPHQCHGSSGAMPDGNWKHSSCYVSCVCN